MNIELTEQDIEDLKQGLYIAIKQLDQGNSIDKELSDRLEAFSKRLDK